MNAIQIMYKLGGKDSIAPFYSQILSIAQQCPYKGGNAVYRARALLNHITDTIYYDDASACSQVGIFRSFVNQSPKIEDEIKIIPNPANQYADIV